jgi:hypothetical protein
MNNYTKKYFNPHTGSTTFYNDKGIKHRLDGPAYIGFDECRAWYVNGFLHREDGPALIYPGGDQLYFLNGKEINSSVEYWKLVRLKCFW